MRLRTPLVAGVAALLLLAGVAHYCYDHTPQAPPPEHATATATATTAPFYSSTQAPAPPAQPPPPTTESAADAPQSANVLSPGKAGSVSLGMSIDEVTRLLGKPDAIDGTIQKFLSHGLELNVSESRRTVHLISCLGPNLSANPFYQGVVPYSGKTAEGIGIGSSKDDVLQAYGTPTRRSDVTTGDSGGFCSYQNLGMSFQFDLSGRVQHILVSQPK